MCRELDRNESVVVHGDLNARVGNEVLEGIVGRHGVPGRNESGERLLEMCAEQELVVGNSWFKKNDVYKYTWLRMAERRVVGRALMDYMLLPKRMIGRMLDVKVWRGEGGGMSDHFFGGSSAEIGGRRSAGRMEGVRNVFKVCELNNSVKKRAYQESLRGKYEVCRGGEVESVEREWEKFIVMECTNDVRGIIIIIIIIWSPLCKARRE